MLGPSNIDMGLVLKWAWLGCVNSRQTIWVEVHLGLELGMRQKPLTSVLTVFLSFSSPAVARQGSLESADNHGLPFLSAACLRQRALGGETGGIYLPSPVAQGWQLEAPHRWFLSCFFCFCPLFGSCAASAARTVRPPSTRAKPGCAGHL